MIKKNNHGFTLVELLVTVAILGILAAIVIPVYTSVSKNMDKKFCSMAQMNLSIYMSQYKSSMFPYQYTQFYGFATTIPNTFYLPDGARIPGKDEDEETDESDKPASNITYVRDLSSCELAKDAEGNMKRVALNESVGKITSWNCGEYDGETNTWKNSYVYIKEDREVNADLYIYYDKKDKEYKAI